MESLDSSAWYNTEEENDFWYDHLDARRQRGFRRHYAKMSMKCRDGRRKAQDRIGFTHQYYALVAESKETAWKQANRTKRPGMTMHVRGGWQLQIYDNVDVAEERGTQDGKGDLEVMQRLVEEVSLVDLARPGKLQKCGARSLCAFL